MSDHLVFYINGVRVAATGPDASCTLTDFLRTRRRLTGTKIVCNEGDCGACSVLVGRPNANGTALRYEAIDACIAFTYQMDRAHVVTVEGLREANGGLCVLQRAMAEGHGSQCGFCTPGIVVTLQGMLEDTPASGVDASANGHAADDPHPLGEDRVRPGLSGNLCRCTGYQQIFDAAAAIDPAEAASMNDRYPPRPMLDDFARLGDQPVTITADTPGHPGKVFLPRTLEQAIRFRGANPGCRVASGTTDLGVQHNHGRPAADRLLCLRHVDELRRVELTDKDTLRVGAAATWAEVDRAAAGRVPEYHAILDRFGSPQVRHMGTLVGNLANGSPIADSLPFHLVTHTTLTLASPRGRRVVDLNDFYLGYKRLDLADDELIVAADTPLPRPDQRLRLYKVSRRRDMDISTVTAGFLLTLNDANDTITAARVAFGGVGPVAARLPDAEEALVGRPLTETTLRDAGRVARSLVSPLTDVRGGADFRRQLVENLFVKCYHDLCDEPALQTA
ncbi:MAG: FAD binding domain-containing protein [Planctomycetota bacterium]